MGPGPLHPVLLPRHAGFYLLRLRLCQAVMDDERAFLGQPVRPAGLSFQVADPDRRRAHGDAGHRRGDPLHPVHPHRRMATAAARRRGAREGHAGEGRARRLRGRQGARGNRSAEGLDLMFGIGNPELGVIMLGLFVVFIMFGFPIAFTLMALGVFFGYFAMGDLIFNLLVQRTYSVMTNDVLISIPLFVFMGYIIERANILDRLFKALQLAAGPVPASLALATCAIFATATGIVGACVTLMGLLAFPAMLRAGYDVKIAAGAVCAGGCLGILIPPSVMLILYGATAGVSVVKLYAGAFFPGIMLAFLYILFTMVMALLNPKLAPKLPKEQRAGSFSHVAKAL